MTEQVIRIGIIGSGGIARMHARAYKRIPGVVVAAVADIVPGRAQALIDEEGLAEQQHLTIHASCWNKSCTA
ncbi:Gfo/Idh/MocA family oxidoreductase [Paenibacillus sp. MER TA 81-3]|uniref:Gfo/Idh/MocA family oxidoreductase n=1 Tax=Paenibacillus sp. MER TA 81-3 TaxID=2939573 RepID=UPI0028899ADD|nr:Gfo/Idh/MocA family oxidoreductase [Paenibacillus sp. MER TA 81-3]